MMKVCRAAALALLGWYLMMPPLGADQLYDNTAPISKWSINSSFNNAMECIDRQAHMLQRAKDQHDKHGENAWLSSACIVSDDPRLKGN